MRGLFWAAIGAGLMYFMDPKHSEERQTWLREKYNKYMGDTDFGSMIGGFTGNKSDDYSTQTFGTGRDITAGTVHDTATHTATAPKPMSKAA